MLFTWGQTGRLLKTHIAEHKNHINRRTIQYSVITDHRLINHEFDWDGYKSWMRRVCQQMFDVGDDLHKKIN